MCVCLYAYIHAHTHTHTRTQQSIIRAPCLAEKQLPKRPAPPQFFMIHTPAHGCSAGVSWKFVHVYMSVCRHVRNHGIPDSVRWAQATTDRYKLGSCRSKPADQRPSRHCREVNVCNGRNIPQSVLTTRGTSYSLQCEHKRGPPSCLSQTSIFSLSHHNFEF